MKKILLQIALTLALTNAFGTPYYWVGGIGNSSAPIAWGVATNWSTTSGTGTGTPSTGNGAVPGSGDIAIFDASAGNVNPFIDISGQTINIGQVQISPAAAATNVVSFVNTAISFTITGDLTLNGIKPSGTVYYGAISDYGSNTFTVGGNILTGSYGGTLVTIPTSNTNLTAGKIALTGTNPVIQTPVSPAIITATVNGGAVTALNISNNGGTGYFATPTLVLVGGGGSGATATVTVTNGVITGYTITAAGTGYTSAPTVFMSYGGYMTFQNLDISSSSYVTCPTTALSINGNLNLQTGAKLAMANELRLNSTSATPFNSPGTISGSGVIVPLNTNPFKITVQGSVPAQYTMTSPQSVGTINFDTSVPTIANALAFTRPNSTTTIGSCNQISTVPTLAVSGSLTLSAGILNDGGNTLTFAYTPAIVSSNTTAGAAIHTGTGKIKAVRSSANPVLLTTGMNVSVGNLEIGTGVAYSLGANTTLNVNGTLLMSTANSSIANSGTLNIASTGTLQVNNGSITGTMPTYATGSTLIYNNATANSEALWPSTSGPTNVSILQGSVTTTTDKTINGNFTIGSSSAPALTISAGTKLIFANGASIIHTGTGTVTNSGNGFQYGLSSGASSDRVNIVVSNTSGSVSIKIPEGSGFSSGVSGAGLGSLTVNGNGGTCTINTSTTLNNGVVIGTGANLNLGGYNLFINGGNWSNSGTFTVATGNVQFNNIGQTISNASGTESFYKLTYSKSAGTLTANCNISVANVLTLTNGKIVLGSNDLTIGASGSISGASSSNYIVTNGTGKLNQTVGAGTTVLFPVGASITSYDPVSVTPTGATTFGIKAYSTLSGNPVYGVLYNTKEWDISPAPASASSTVISLTPSNLVQPITNPLIGHFVNGAYVNNSNVSVSNGTFTGTFDTFSPFVTGANIDVTGLKNENNLQQSIYAANGLLQIANAQGENINIYSIAGSKVCSLTADADKISIPLEKGLFIVKIGTQATKIILK